MYKRDWTR